ncbi:GGDEF domain-containing protein [Paraburkholderia antibiotica]|uniref:diguanylate cyclase n=1 Tax=Paraburkholderia antibiotica TaxID=2728839 RepID=A0A7X9X6B9_9BURK|nr:GGDEF domain-containing protein [Paraburkholderia antibiotica]NML32324.1 GGDEF domain-containing protein [Paraburkholderia antibiotica]
MQPFIWKRKYELRAGLTIEESEFVSLHPFSISLQFFGLISVILARVLAPAGAVFDDVTTCEGIAGIIVGLCISVVARRLETLLIGGTIAMSFIAFSFRLDAESFREPVFWILSIGSLIALGAAPVYEKLHHYMISIVLVWLILCNGLNQRIYNDSYRSWILTVIFNSILLGSVINFFMTFLRVMYWRSRNELYDMAFKDSLTGIGNRREFLEKIEALRANGSEHIYFLMIDVDDFKRINDTCGHAVGDAVLKQIASTIKACAGELPHGRLGGEEFGIAFEGTCEELSNFARNFLRSLENSVMAGTKVRASIGIARYEQDLTLSQCMSRADHALYAAKKAGKNRFAFYSDLNPPEFKDQSGHSVH